jgi:glycosyltransferase involved in cell wall biosynthesis
LVTERGQNILWIVDHLPDRRRTGREARQLEMIAALTGAGAEATIWAEHGGDTVSSAEQLEGVGARWEAPPPDSRWTPGPAVRLSHRLEDLLSRTWDVVIVAGPRHTAAVSLLLRKGRGVPLIADLATVRFPTAHTREAPAKSKLRAAGDLVKALTGADAVITASQPDASFLTDASPNRPTFTFGALGDDSGPSVVPSPDGGLLFIGDLLHHPNLQAVEWWMEELASLVHARVGGPIPLRVVGGGAEAYHRQWDRPDRVTVGGWQNDLSVEHAGARLLIVPLPYATGTGGRIASALAHGLPVVASSAAAAVLSADLAALVTTGQDARRLAGAIGRLMTDDDAWLEQRRLIEEEDFATRRLNQAMAFREWMAAIGSTGMLSRAGGGANRRSGNRRALRRPSRAS